MQISFKFFIVHMHFIVQTQVFARLIDQQRNFSDAKVSFPQIIEKRFKPLIIFWGDPGSRIVFKKSSSNTVQAEFIALTQSTKTTDFCFISVALPLLISVKTISIE